MQYRQFGKLDWESSILGFGAMRLPMQEGSSTELDVEESIKMMRYAIDNGVNYLDTAYPYHGGKSETIVGQVLKDGYREKVKLATKMPTWLINSKDDCDRTCFMAWVKNAGLKSRISGLSTGRKRRWQTGISAVSGFHFMMITTLLR